ncbi:Cof-type HAD-IIB family hydrolase [Kallotenue papyrolyticum]|uniref:Cof-type HAD-IIB family hydrolase n=1 Tax=Kallotenue papyrolyticum TaxID=1325125 RepID=UPI000478635A|nr:Cof-type HAD-IIB family hydrolase [Kallotenue papyrolyticum]
MTKPATQHYRLLALDLDGTLIGPDLQIPPGTREAIAAFQRQGGRVTLATGRTLRTTLPFAAALGVDGPLICYQGALVTDHHTGRVLLHEPVPPALATEAVHRLLAAGVYVQAYIDDELYVPWAGAEIAFYQTFSEVKLAVHVVADLAAFVAEHPPTKLLFIAHEDLVEPHLLGLQQHFAERLHIVRSHVRFGELTAPGCTKGRALAWLAQQLGMQRHEVAAAGDQANDLEMIAWAGLGMAVRGSPAPVQDQADVLIDGPHQAGVATAIRRYLLAEAPSQPSGEQHQALS